MATRDNGLALALDDNSSSVPSALLPGRPSAGREALGAKACPRYHPPGQRALAELPFLSFRTPRVARASAWGCPLQFIREADAVVLSHRVLVYTAPDFGKGRKDDFPAPPGIAPGAY